MEIIRPPVLSDGLFTEPDDCSSHNECGPHATCIEGNNYNFTCECDYPLSGRLCDGKDSLFVAHSIFLKIFLDVLFRPLEVKIISIRFIWMSLNVLILRFKDE